MKGSMDEDKFLSVGERPVWERKTLLNQSCSRKRTKRKN